MELLKAVELGSIKIKNVFKAGFSSFILSDQGKIFGFGSNVFGILGIGSAGENIGGNLESIQNLKSVLLSEGQLPVKNASCGPFHCCAVMFNNAVKCWGANDDGRLGYEDQRSRGTQIDELGENLPFVDLGKNMKVKHTAVGDEFSCALIDPGFVKCWGRNIYGQLGLGDRALRGQELGTMGENLPFIEL
jgi:alpha-tubulin suppressor-like RCC1 family protein